MTKSLTLLAIAAAMDPLLMARLDKMSPEKPKPREPTAADEERLRLAQEKRDRKAAQLRARLEMEGKQNGKQ